MNSNQNIPLRYMNNLDSIMRYSSDLKQLCFRPLSKRMLDLELHSIRDTNSDQTSLNPPLNSICGGARESEQEWMVFLSYLL